MTRGFAPSLPVEFPKMGSFRRPRPRFMSSPALSDLPRFQAARQALQLSSNSAWNSVQTAVINVFKGGGLQSNELYTLNENIRRLLKSELGSFITDYFQNQLLAKGLLFVEEKIKLCEGENRMDVLADVWDHFFTETLPTLQAIFYPVQEKCLACSALLFSSHPQLHPAPLREDLKHLCGWFTPCVHRLLPSLQYSLFGQQWVLRRHTREGQELTIRQISLLGFRDLVLLKVKLDDLLLLAQPQLPSSIVQMLLILQSCSQCFSLCRQTWHPTACMFPPRDDPECPRAHRPKRGLFAAGGAGEAGRFSFPRHQRGPQRLRPHVHTGQAPLQGPAQGHALELRLPDDRRQPAPERDGPDPSDGARGRGLPREVWQCPATHGGQCPLGHPAAGHGHQDALGLRGGAWRRGQVPASATQLPAAPPAVLQ
nr:proline-rich protein 5-like isoform X2 [Globicephala melas]